MKTRLSFTKQVRLNFAPSSNFTIRNIEDKSDRSKRMDTNNNAKPKSVDNGQASSCDAADSEYTPSKVPRWSTEPQLSRSLRSQQEKISPDAIFADQASIRPEDLAQMFPQTAQERDIWNPLSDLE